MKRLTTSPFIEQRLKRAFGDDVDSSKFAIFEAVALNSLPIRQKHPLYKGAVATSTYLGEMARAVNAESLPVQIMHDRDALPIGRVFYGEVLGDELRVLFTVDPEHGDKISMIESGTVDQVSVSTLPGRLECSSCGSNYLDEDSDPMATLMGECGNGHTIGRDGTHARMTALSDWFELSLVGQGGAQNARISSASTSKLSGTHAFERLAASGFNPHFLALNAGPGEVAATDLSGSALKSKDYTMDLSVLLTTLGNATTEAATFKAELSASKTETANLKNEVESLKAQIVDLTATSDELAALKLAKDELEGLKGEREAVKGFCVKLSAMMGKPGAEIGNVGEFLNSVDLPKLKAGGVAQDGIGDVKSRPASFASAAFITRK